MTATRRFQLYYKTKVDSPSLIQPLPLPELCMYILMGHISLVDHSVFRGPRELLGIRAIQIRSEGYSSLSGLKVVEHEISTQRERKINCANINTTVKLRIFITIYSNLFKILRIIKYFVLYIFYFNYYIDLSSNY